MKDQKLSFLAIAAGIIFTSAATVQVAPQRPQKKVPSGERVSMRIKERTANYRPKAPSRQMVTCEYDGSYLTFDFVLPEGECEATVTENFSGISQTYTFDSSNLSADVYVGELYESTVTITTDAGSSYSGALTADPEQP